MSTVEHLDADCATPLPGLLLKKMKWKKSSRPQRYLYAWGPQISTARRDRWRSSSHNLRLLQEGTLPASGIIETGTMKRGFSIVIGGVVAGATLSVIDIAMYGAILKAPMEQAMKVLPKPRIVQWQVPWYISLDVVAGIALVWLYAALRPRFGASLATAAKAGVVGWFFTSLWTTLVQWPLNLMPLNLTVIIVSVALVQWTLAAVLGAKFYRDV
jgi:hypothetical protein